jgi:hypothetical protein
MWVEPDFSVPRLFFPLLKLSLSFKRRSKNSWWKTKFLFKVFWPRHSLMSSEGWRCNFFTHPEAAKTAKSQTPLAMSVANRQSDLWPKSGGHPLLPVLQY